MGDQNGESSRGSRHEGSRRGKETETGGEEHPWFPWTSRYAGEMTRR
jgi:hypothetical protein